MIRQILILLLWVVFNFNASAQTERALALRENVFAVSTESQSGFGVVTGQEGRFYYLITSAKLVKRAVEANEKIKIKGEFWNEGHSGVKVEVIGYYNNGAVALLRRRIPTINSMLFPIDISFEKHCIGTYKVGRKVAYIGRSGEWYVPNNRELGTIDRVLGGKIMTRLALRASNALGAPLIGKSGIIGIITDIDNNRVTAVGIDQIKTALSKENEQYFQLTGGDMNDHDGNTYTSKVMDDGKRWMTQNLSVEVPGSGCYDGEPANCMKFGRLYNWEEALAGCKEFGAGWRLPTKEEWDKLIEEEFSTAEVIHIVHHDFGFQGGGCIFNNGYSLRLKREVYWSASEYSGGKAWYFDFSGGRWSRVYNQLANWNNSDKILKSFSFSVRCITDE